MTPITHRLSPGKQATGPRTSSGSSLLAIDTSTRTVGLAIHNGHQVSGEFSWTSLDYHTVELAPAVTDLLAKTRLKPAQLGALAVALGPGSFTGLRIGLALAKGLALAQDIPLIGIPTLDILAAGQPILSIPLVAVLQAGRGRLAVAWYQVTEDEWKPTTQVEILTPQELSERIQSPTWVCGEFTEEERRLLSRKRKNVQLASPALSLRRPAFLAELAFKTMASWPGR